MDSSTFHYEYDPDLLRANISELMAAINGECSTSMQSHVNSVHLGIKPMHCAICNKGIRGDMARHCRTEEHTENGRKAGK